MNRILQERNKEGKRDGKGTWSMMTYIVKVHGIEALDSLVPVRLDVLLIYFTEAALAASTALMGRRLPAPHGEVPVLRHCRHSAEQVAGSKSGQEAVGVRVEVCRRLSPEASPTEREVERR